METLRENTQTDTLTAALVQSAVCSHSVSVGERWGEGSLCEREPLGTDDLSLDVFNTPLDSSAWTEEGLRNGFNVSKL